MTTDSIFRELSKKIREYRRASDITQEEFGKTVGLSGRRIRDIEAGRAQGLSLSALVRIVGRLGCELRIVEKEEGGSETANENAAEYDSIFNKIAASLTKGEYR